MTVPSYCQFRVFTKSKDVCSKKWRICKFLISINKSDRNVSLFFYAMHKRDKINEIIVMVRGLISCTIFNFINDISEPFFHVKFSFLLYIFFVILLRPPWQWFFKMQNFSTRQFFLVTFVCYLFTAIFS